MTREDREKRDAIALCGSACERALYWADLHETLGDRGYAAELRERAGWWSLQAFREAAR